MRQLRFHEKKLLKKVDFLEWKSDNKNQTKVMRTYHIQNPADYIAYSRLAGQITKIINKLSLLHPSDPIRAVSTQKLLDRLYEMGLISVKKSLSSAEKINVSCFCRRRLAIIMMRLKMAETTKEAVTFIEQGHVRVGPEPVCDPAYLVTRSKEDYVTWVDTSKIKRKVLKYNDKLDDYDLL